MAAALSCKYCLITHNLVCKRQQTSHCLFIFMFTSQTCLYRLMLRDIKGTGEAKDLMLLPPVFLGAHSLAVAQETTCISLGYKPSHWPEGGQRGPAIFVKERISNLVTPYFVIQTNLHSKCFCMDCLRVLICYLTFLRAEKEGMDMFM